MSTLMNTTTTTRLHDRTTASRCSRSGGLRCCMSYRDKEICHRESSRVARRGGLVTLVTLVSFFAKMHGGNTVHGWCGSCTQWS